MPGTSGIWDGEWIVLAAAPITADDVGTLPYSVGVLVKWVAFLSSLHWPADGADLGCGGVSFVEMLILYELWAGERLVLEKAVPRYRSLGAQFQCRMFRLVQALIFGVRAGSLEPFSGHCVLCLVVLAGLCLAILVLITAGFGTLDGRSVVMVSLLGREHQLRRVSASF